MLPGIEATWCNTVVLFALLIRPVCDAVSHHSEIPWQTYIIGLMQNLLLPSWYSGQLSWGITVLFGMNVSTTLECTGMTLQHDIQIYCENLINDACHCFLCCMYIDCIDSVSKVKAWGWYIFQGLILWVLRSFMALRVIKKNLGPWHKQFLRLTTLGNTM